MLMGHLLLSNDDSPQKKLGVEGRKLNKINKIIFYKKKKNRSIILYSIATTKGKDCRRLEI